jgi:TetR/AcrR family transcriptional regulator
LEKISLKEQEKIVRKTAILNAALSLFAEKDYHEVTVDEIADLVGLSKGTLYLYFENKEHLFISIIKEKTDELLSGMSKAIRGEDPYEKRLEQLVRSWLGFFEEHRNYFKIIHSEKSRIGADHQDLMREHMMATFRDYEMLLRGFIQEGIGKKYFRDIQPDVIVKGLRGLLNSFTFQCVFFGSENSLVDETPALLDLFLHGVNKVSE